MLRAIIIDPIEVLTDESQSEREGIAAVRSLVASAGIRVTETAVTQAEQGAVDSFAPNFLDSFAFRLAGSDPTRALKVLSQTRKAVKPVPRLRPEAAQIIHACHNMGWAIALAQNLREEIARTLHTAGVWQYITIKGPPAGMKISLPDPRVIEFLLGSLKVAPAECLVLGTRMDLNIRPANLLHMQAIHLRMGRHGSRQQPRDLHDAADYVAGDVPGLLKVIAAIR